MKTERRWKKAALALGLALAFTAARADIVVGETVGITGPVAATVKEALIGANLYIDWINATGGVRGEKIDLVTLDDKFDVKQAAENARLNARRRALGDPRTLEAEARKLGMVRPTERAYVVTGLPKH